MGQKEGCIKSVRGVFLLKETEQNETINFYLQLLSKTIDMKQFPFTRVIIENNITKDEYEKLLNMLEKLHYHYINQKEEGFLDFSSLLDRFAGMLDERLDTSKTVYALKKEGYFPSLMDEFIHIMEKRKAE